MGVRHAQLLGPLVHQIHESRLAARDMLRHRHAGVIARRHRDTLDHGVESLGLSRRQIHLRTSHGAGIFAGSHLVGEADLSLMDSLKSKEQRHDLRYAGRSPAFCGVELIDYLTRRAFYQDH